MKAIVARGELDVCRNLFSGVDERSECAVGKYVDRCVDAVNIRTTPEQVVCRCLCCCLATCLFYLDYLRAHPVTSREGLVGLLGFEIGVPLLGANDQGNVAGRLIDEMLQYRVGGCTRLQIDKGNVAGTGLPSNRDNGDVTISQRGYFDIVGQWLNDNGSVNMKISWRLPTNFHWRHQHQRDTALERLGCGSPGDLQKEAHAGAAASN